MTSAVVEAVTSEWFLRGLLFGLGAFGIGLAASAGWRGFRRLPQPAPMAAALVAAAALLALPVAREVPPALWQAAGLLAVAGLLHPLARRVPLLPALLAAPGAWWLFQKVEFAGAGWVPWAVAAAVAAGAPLVASFDRRHASRGLGPVLVAVTVAGAYATLPDTEEVLVLAGAVLPMMLLAWPRALAALGAWGIYPLIGVLAWVATWGGRGREGAMVGAVAGLGVLVAEPVARAMRGTTLLDRLPRRWWAVPACSIFHGLVVFGTSRLAGLRESAIAAGAISVAVLAATVAILAVASGGRRSGRQFGP